VTQRFAQNTILGVARAHFVSRGFAGARVDEIAAESGYSKAMIYHYYGNKENLYVAVLEEVYKHFVAPHRVVNVEDIGPVRALEAFIREGAASVRKDPAILNLLAIENLNKAAYLRGSTVPRAIYPPLLTQLKEIIDVWRERRRVSARDRPCAPLRRVIFGHLSCRKQSIYTFRRARNRYGQHRISRSACRYLCSYDRRILHRPFAGERE